jgi:hypothetical protein
VQNDPLPEPQTLAQTPAAEAPATPATPATTPSAVVDVPAPRAASVTINGEAVAVAFSQTADVATLQIADATEATAEIVQPGLAIFESSAGSLVLESVVQVSDRGNSVSANAVTGETAQTSVELTAPEIEQTTINLTNEEGAEEVLNVSIREDGTMVIDLPANVSLTDSRQVTLMGVAAAKRIGITVDRLKSIVINRM